MNKRNHYADSTHHAGFESLVAEVITIAILDYKHKRLGEKANSARKDGREYAELLAEQERSDLRWFIFGGPMDELIALAGLQVDGDAIRRTIER